MIDQQNLIAAAQTWYAAGCSVVPPRTDGTKSPIGRWEDYQTTRPTPEQMHTWYRSGAQQGVGIVCGAISGRLEMFELEALATDAESLTKVQDACRDAGILWLWDSLVQDGYAEWTPSGGLHLLYRITDHEVPGNTKIATRLKRPEEYTEKDHATLARSPRARIIATLAETRGEGGYVIVAPTGGTVHPSGLDWMVVGGQIGVIPTVTWEDRTTLHAAVATALDEPAPRAPQQPPRAPMPQLSSGAKRPGDDFNERADWPSILEPHGWTFSHYSGIESFWLRPGKQLGERHSASVGYKGRDCLYVWSSSTVFPTETPITKFGAYTELEHAGDFAAATRELARQGYGEQRPVAAPRQTLGNFVPTFPVDTPVLAPNIAAPSPVFSLPVPRGVHDHTFSGAATRFVDLHGPYVRWVSEEKAWRVWNGSVWAEDDGSRVSMAFEALTEDMRLEVEQLKASGSEDIAKSLQKHVVKCRDSGRSSVLALIASKVTVSAAVFDADTRYLNLRNGIWDCKDMRLLPHDPRYYLTKQMNCSYDPQAQAPRTLKFLETTITSVPMREFLLRALGYTLTGEADQKAFFILQGDPNTGKTQVTEMMTDLFGSYAVTAGAGTFHKREANGNASPDLHALRGARFVSTSETSQDTRLDEELIKRFTGKDRLSTRTLYQKPQEWIPQCTLWVATNHLPKFSSDEEAIWRRVKTVPFTTVFTDDGSNGNKAEGNIGRKLAATEADGIFLLLLAGLAQYQETGHLGEPQELKESVASHKREVDPVAQFWDEKMELGELVADPDGSVDPRQLYAVYEQWCKLNKYLSLGNRRFLNCVRALAGYKRMDKSNSRRKIPGWRLTGVNGILGTM